MPIWCGIISSGLIRWGFYTIKKRRKNRRLLDSFTSYWKIIYFYTWIVTFLLFIDNTDVVQWWSMTSTPTCQWKELLKYYDIKRLNNMTEACKRTLRVREWEFNKRLAMSLDQLVKANRRLRYGSSILSMLLKDW